MERTKGELEALIFRKSKEPFPQDSWLLCMLEMRNMLGAPDWTAKPAKQSGNSAVVGVSPVFKPRAVHCVKEGNVWKVDLEATFSAWASPQELSSSSPAISHSQSRRCERSV